MGDVRTSPACVVPSLRGRDWDQRRRRGREDENPLLTPTLTLYDTTVAGEHKKKTRVSALVKRKIKHRRPFSGTGTGHRTRPVSGTGHEKRPGRVRGKEDPRAGSDRNSSVEDEDLAGREVGDRGRRVRGRSWGEDGTGEDGTGVEGVPPTGDDTAGQTDMINTSRRICVRHALRDTFDDSPNRFFSPRGTSLQPPPQRH